MLERTAGCLESGSLRRLLPASKKSTKSCRALHSGFWTHGALDLELSPLWTALVRASDTVEQSVDERAQRNNSRAHHATLLEFLYPAGTLNFLRTYSTLWGDKQDGRFVRGSLGKIGYRQYTSSAIGAVAADGLIYSPSLLARNNKEKEDSIKSLYTTLRLTRSTDYEEAWRKFMQLEGADQQPLRRALIQYFRDSERIIDAERTTDLFEKLDEGQRDADTYRWTTRAFLRLRNLSDAIQLHTTAIEKLGSPAGSEELLAHYLKNSSWSRAAALFGEVQRFHIDTTHNIKFDMYAALDTIPNLPTVAKGLVDYGNRTSHGKEFAVSIIRIALLRSENFDETTFLLLFQTVEKWGFLSSSFYEETFSMLLRLNKSKLVVQCYRSSRKTYSHLKFWRKTLNSVLKIFCQHHSVLGMKQVLDDYFKMHGAPSQFAYKLCMQEFAHQGDARTVQALFDQYTARFSSKEAGKQIKLDVNDFTPLLQVHTKRGEFKEVLDLFHRIEADHGLRPSILCYNILLNACGKVHDFKKAYSTFDKIIADPTLIPDDYTIGTMLGICSKRGDTDLAMDIYKMAEELNITPTMAMVDCIINCHCQDDQLAEAEKQCEEALQMDFQGSRTRMWNYLLIAYAMQHDIVNVNRILQRMTEVKVDYDQYTYSALMQALCMVKQPHRAYSILKDVMPEAGITATPFHYAIVMGGFLSTGELRKVFHVHNRLSRRSIPQTASTNLILVKGLAKEAEASRDEKFQTQNNDIDYKHALDLFSSVMKSADAQEIASTTRKGTKGMPIDVAYPSMLYGFVIHILGQNSQFKAVDDLYNAFYSMLPALDRSNPPINILSAYMKTKLREGNHDAVLESWNLAIAEARKAGSPLPSLNVEPVDRDPRLVSGEQSRLRLVQGQRNSNSGHIILPSHRYRLSSHLNTYMRSLYYQDNRSALTKLIDDFQSMGFELDGSNWNLYVELHARRFSLKTAFMVCEKKLMQGWTGWARLRRERPERNRLDLEIRRLRKDPRHLRPEYYTLLWLAKGYLTIEAQAGEQRAAESMMNWMRQECPKTVNALQTMQRSDEDQERMILQN